MTKLSDAIAMESLASFQKFITELFSSVKLKAITKGMPPRHDLQDQEKKPKKNKLKIPEISKARQFDTKIV